MVARRFALEMLKAEACGIRNRDYGIDTHEISQLRTEKGQHHRQRIGKPCRFNDDVVDLALALDKGRCIYGRDHLMRPLDVKFVVPLFALSAEKIAGKVERYLPNVLGVLADGAIGGKPRHSCDVEHARARPIECRQPQPFNASLRCKIGIEIRCDHVVVGMPQRIHERGESVNIVR